MLDDAPAANSAVFLLADHLDAALAAGEDLLATRLPALADLDQAEDAAERELSRFVARLGRLEAALIGRLLQARRRLAELPRQDGDFKPVARLFVAGTAILLDVVEAMGDPAQARFEAGHDRLPFLRDRGLLARDAAGLPLYETLDVTETFRVGAKLELGALLDLVSKLLDALDDRYDLYGDGIGRRSAGEEAAAAEAADAADAGGDDGLPATAATAGEATADGAPAAGTGTTGGEPAAPLTPGTLAAALQQLERAKRT